MKKKEKGLFISEKNTFFAPHLELGKTKKDVKSLSTYG
jgi:hypothetical protein